MKLQQNLGRLALALAGAFLLTGGSNVAQAAPVVRTVFGTELEGGLDAPLPDTTVLTDSVVGQLCSADENAADCVGTPYQVANGLVSASTLATLANEGTVVFGVALCDDITNCAGTLSDQLYLSVTRFNADQVTLNWCWDSDLDPNINICQTNITGVTPINIQEVNGVMDLTSFFTGEGGPLAAGAWNVSVLSDAAVPEPITISLFGAGLVGAAAMRRRKKK